MTSTSTVLKPHIDTLERLFVAGGYSHSTESCPANTADLLGGEWLPAADADGWLCGTCVSVEKRLAGRLAEETARAGVTARDDVDYRPWGNGTGSGNKGAPAANPASPKQLTFIDRLVAEKGDAGAALLEAAGPLTGGRGGSASKLIDALMALGRTANAAALAADAYRWTKVAGEWLVTGPPATVGDTITISKSNGETAQAVVTCELPDSRFRVRRADSVDDENRAEAALAAEAVGAGHYAIESTGHNDLAFYRVDRPEKGAYVGRVFVKLIVGGKPDSNVPRSHVAGILARIAADPDAGPRYGQEIGRCCRCNRTLTDETSRSLGIGPDCRTRD